MDIAGLPVWLSIRYLGMPEALPNLIKLPVGNVLVEDLQLGLSWACVRVTGDAISENLRRNCLVK